LYGIGVGPGDPELMTLKAVRVLRRVDVVLAARSTKNDYSLALENARPYLKPGARIVNLGFPMTQDEAELRAAWEQNAALAAETLDLGADAAFLTLGDPLLYSTFTYLYRTIKRLRPEIECEIVPGITSFQAAAALTGTVLAEKDEYLLVASGVESNGKLAKHLPLTDNLVVLKTYRQFDHIRRTLDLQGLKKNAVLVSKCGQEGQRIVGDLDAVGDEKPPYMSLLLVKRQGRD
jgi:precorrin-2/cobalt-factor-2 C20-methyltransferase